MKKVLTLLLILSMVMPLQGMEKLAKAISNALIPPEINHQKIDAFEAVFSNFKEPITQQVLDDLGIQAMLNAELNEKWPSLQKIYAQKILNMLKERIRPYIQDDEHIFVMDDV